MEALSNEEKNAIIEKLKQRLAQAITEADKHLLETMIAELKQPEPYYATDDPNYKEYGKITSFEA